MLNNLFIFYAPANDITALFIFFSFFLFSGLQFECALILCFHGHVPSVGNN